MIKRTILIVIDSVGVGALPDAHLYGDEDCNTLCNIAKHNNGINITNMEKLGIGNIEGVSYLNRVDYTIGSYGKMAELSVGKDTTTGHWEIAGIHTKELARTFPQGFPDSIIDKFIERSNIPGILGNIVASGTEIIKDFGEEHVLTKKPIVYTSSDSVFQIACHEDVYSPDELYRLCEVARELMQGEYNITRVIARPFTGEAGNYERTHNRRDFSIKPDENNILSKMKNAGYDVIGVGKIEDIFAGVGITQSVHTIDNHDGVDKTIEFIKEDNEGLIFTNLVEFDSKWGHRNDYINYARGLEEFDLRIPEIIKEMKDSDILVVTADHGCDPTTPGTDHTREYVPLLIYGKHIRENVNLGTLKTFADVGQTLAEIFKLERLEIGTSLVDRILL